MAGITLVEAEAQLAEWLAASRAVAKGQAYSLGNRALTRADAKEIREQVSFWNRQVLRLTRGGIRVGGVIPVDG